MLKSKDAIQSGTCTCCHVVNPDQKGKNNSVRFWMSVKRKLEKAFPNMAWSVRVHHNIRWFGSITAIDGRFQVYASDTTSFWTMFNREAGHGGGEPWLCVPGTHKTPDVAVQKQLEYSVTALSLQLENDGSILRELLHAGGKRCPSVK